MYKIRQSFLYICAISLMFYCVQSYALGSQYDVICVGIQATPKGKQCIDNVRSVSKCRTDTFKKNVCDTWGGLSTGPLYRVQQGLLYSDIDTRTSVPTSDMKKSILRYKTENEAVTYAWEQWKDLDFILMIQEESLWEEFIFGDSGTSIGYCQFSKIHGKELYDAYINAQNWKDRITLCHNHYLKFADKVGIVFHGWKTRMRNLPSFSFR